MTFLFIHQLEGKESAQRVFSRENWRFNEGSLVKRKTLWLWLLRPTRSFLLFQSSLCWRHRSNMCRYVKNINFDIHSTRAPTLNVSLNAKSLNPHTAFSLVRLATKLGLCELTAIEWLALPAGNGTSPWSYQPDVFANPPFVRTLLVPVSLPLKKVPNSTISPTFLKHTKIIAYTGLTLMFSLFLVFVVVLVVNSDDFWL